MKSFYLAIMIIKRGLIVLPALILVMLSGCSSSEEQEVVEIMNKQ